MMPYIWKHPFGLQWPSIHSYGLMAVIALIMAMWLVTRESRRSGLDPDRMFNLVVALFLVGLLGARVLYIVVNWKTFSESSALRVFELWKGGLVWYGGILFAVPFGLWWLRRKKLPVWEAADILYTAAVFGLAFARWGCLLAGCCYGAQCDLPWAIRYTNPDAIAVHEHGGPTDLLHPAPIYASLVAFAITGILLLLQRRKRFPGQVLAVGLCLYAVARFFLETIRGDDVARGSVHVGGLTLSTSQAIGIVLFAVGVLIYIVLGRRTRARPPGEADASS